MQVLFCSDLHIGHKLASEKRGYVSVEEHDRAIIDTLKDQCNKRSLLYVLGDVCFKIELMPMLDEIPGRKILIIGNHEKFDTQVYLEYFEQVHGFRGYKEFWLSHCPIHPQEMYRKQANLHGHIHKNTRSPVLPLPYINLNWDFWGRAVSLHEIREFVKSGEVPYE